MNRSEEFEALAMPLAREMYVTAFRILGDTDRAEDIVRETYVSAWKMFDQCGRNFKVWIFRILVQLCLPAIRAQLNRSASEKSFKQIAQNVLRERHHE